MEERRVRIVAMQKVRLVTGTHTTANPHAITTISQLTLHDMLSQ